MTVWIFLKIERLIGFSLQLPYEEMDCFFLKSTGKRGKFWHIINDIRENVADSMEWVFLFPEFVEKVEAFARSLV